MSKNKEKENFLLSSSFEKKEKVIQMQQTRQVLTGSFQYSTRQTAIARALLTSQ